MSEKIPKIMYKVPMSLWLVRKTNRVIYLSIIQSAGVSYFSLKRSAFSSIRRLGMNIRKYEK